jgi:ABC-2 type transport system ATP-binding protein
MIACQKLWKEFGQLSAVSGASFEISGGTICALLGPNGAGKSTLVKMLAGLAMPTRGTMTVCGHPPDDPILREIAGVLPESLALFDALTVAEHLQLIGAVYKIPSAVLRHRRDQLLRILLLEHGRNTFIHQCSYGMKKKTSLAMALLPGPRVLFLDEPFEGLDPVTTETIRTQLRAIAKRGVTVLLTSHNLSLVNSVADQVIMINHGKIVFDSKIDQMPESLEDLYFGLIEPAETEELAWLGAETS